MYTIPVSGSVGTSVQLYILLYNVALHINTVLNYLPN